MVRHCLCAGNGGNGIDVSYGVDASIVNGSGQITDCDASNNAFDGILGRNCVVRNCRAANNGSRGIYVRPGTVSGCWVQNNTFSGIYSDGPGSKIIGNTCIGNNSSADTTSAGIYINDSFNRVENNNVSASGHAGIQVNNAAYIADVVIKNTVSGNGANNYLGLANNDFGPIGTAATATSPWANISH